MLTWVPVANAQLTLAVPLTVAAALQALYVAEAHPASVIVTTGCWIGVPPVGVTVIVFEGPATI